MDKESGKIFRIGYIVVVVFLILITRLWQLQILQGNKYRELSESNRLRIISIPAPRGILLDRNGFPLVRNSSYFCASIIFGEFDTSRRVTLQN
jgi:penicillin-binding protein 2